MKNTVTVLVLFCCFHIALGQNDKSKADLVYVSGGYGIGFLNLAPRSVPSSDKINFRQDNFGSFIQFNLDFKVAPGKYIGAGVSKKQFRSMLTQTGFIGAVPTIADEFNLVHEIYFYDIHYRREWIEKNLSLTAGFSYFDDRINQFYTITVENTAVLILANNRDATPLTVFLALEYFIPINPYLDLGLSGRLDYSIIGVNNIALTPTLRVRF